MFGGTRVGSIGAMATSLKAAACTPQSFSGCYPLHAGVIGELLDSLQVT